MVYVYDLPPPLSLTSTCADILDTTSGTSSHFIDTLVETLNADLQDVLSWCNSNNMSFYVSKIMPMYFSSRHLTLANCDHDISICDICCIIWDMCSSTLEDKLVKFQKRAARVILDCDLYTRSSELFK